MKRMLLIPILAFSLSPLFSQNIIGNWQGHIDVNGNKLPIVFHFYKDSSGKINGKWDSPLQKAMGLPFSGINVDGDSVHLKIKIINGAYEGKFAGKDSITGMWHQAGGQISLNISRSSENNEVEKTVPLHPGEKEIAITSAGGSKIYGTLLSKNNHQKLAIIIAGSGPTDRDGNNPLGVDANSFKMLAWALDSQNIATFRYDKRGIAKSAFNEFKETNLVFDDYIEDAEKIFDYFYDTLGFKNIYFVGHSEGSLIGMVASQKKKVKGYVSVAGMGRSIDAVVEEQLKTQKAPDSLQKKATFIFNQLKKGKHVMDIPVSLQSLLRQSIQPYIISLLKYAPDKEIKKVNYPILILQGACDIQVKVQDAINLNNANKKSMLNIIPFMTHTLKDAGKDCADQNKTYSDSTLPLNRLLVNEIVNFMKK